MEEIINSIKMLFNYYGFNAMFVILLIIIFTNVIKKPIVRHAAKIADRTGLEKAVITKNIALVPFVLAFIILGIEFLIKNNFNFELIKFEELLTSASVYGGLAIATYEGIKLQLKAYASKSNRKNDNLLVKNQLESQESVTGLDL